MRFMTYFAVILVAAACLYLPAVESAPQAVALGPRPAVKADPIMIPDEEALGQDLDNVMEAPAEDPIEVNQPEIQVPSNAEVEVIDEKGRQIEVIKPVRSHKPAPPVQERQMTQQQEKDLDDGMQKLLESLLEYGKNKEIPNDGKTCDKKKLQHKKLNADLLMCYNGFCQATVSCSRTGCNNLKPKISLEEGPANNVTAFKGCKEGTTMPTGAVIHDVDPDSSFWTAYWWVIAMVVVILLIIIGFLIWFFLRQKKKAALKAQGLNAEVASVTPVQTADGPAQVVNLEPISEGGTASSGPSGQ